MRGHQENPRPSPRPARVVLATMIVLGVAAGLGAQSSLWLTYVSGGRRALAEGDLQQALGLFQAAAEEAETGEPVRHAESLYLLGSVERALGSNADARLHLERSRDLYTGQLGPSSPELANVRLELGILHRTLGQLDEAEAELRQALAIRESLLGAMDPSLGRVIRELAGVYSDTGKQVQAEALYRRMLALGSMEKEGRALVEDLLPLAQVYIAQEKHDKALPLLRRCHRALEVDGSATERAEMATLLGGVHERLAEMEEAEQYLRQAAELYAGQGGPSVPSVMAQYQLGEFLRKQDRYEEGEPFFAAALAGAETALEKKDPRLIPLLEDYSSLLWRLGQKGRSSKLQARAKWVRMRSGKGDTK